jgi:Flp pilus assembly protein TadG
MSRIIHLKCNERGAAAIEFAFSLPILVLLIWGIFQCSLLFEANAGMQHALGEGARLATLCVETSSGCDTETDADIKAKMNAKLFGPRDTGGSFTVADPVDASDSKTLSITYTRSMDFLFFPGPNVTLTRSKLVYTPTAT